MSRAVIYARFSCSKQREASIEDQLRVCHEWCRANHHEVVAEYTDHAISGRTDDRPQFQAMIRNAGEAELCVVYMMDRFSRDVYDAPIYKKKLRDHGCRVVSATEAMPDGPEALLIEKIYEGLAAIESAHTAERVKRGMTGNALKCMANGYRVFGYSIVDGFYEVNPQEAAIVREVFNRHNAGENSNSIARDLAQRGVKTLRGNPARYSFIYHMLKNEKYRGVYSWNDIRVEGGMPQIIDDATWCAAQRVKPRRDNGERHVYTFAGRALCAKCGRNMQGSVAYGHGGTYHYYRCPDGHVKPVRETWLVSELAKAIRELLANDNNVNEIAQAVEEYYHSTDAAARRTEAAKRLTEANRTIDNLTKAVADGMPWELAAPKMEEARVAAEAISHEIAVQDASCDFDRATFCEFLHVAVEFDDVAIVDAMVYQLLVSNVDVVAVLNFDLNNEPARLTVERVRAIDEWWTKEQTTRTCVIDGYILVGLRRAA